MHNLGEKKSFAYLTTLIFARILVETWVFFSLELHLCNTICVTKT